MRRSCCRRVAMTAPRAKSSGFRSCDCSHLAPEIGIDRHRLPAHAPGRRIGHLVKAVYQAGFRFSELSRELNKEIRSPRARPHRSPPEFRVQPGAPIPPIWLPWHWLLRSAGKSLTVHRIGKLRDELADNGQTGSSLEATANRICTGAG
jgi:hypothetical protein